MALPCFHCGWTQSWYFYMLQHIRLGHFNMVVKHWRRKKEMKRMPIEIPARNIQNCVCSTGNKWSFCTKLIHKYLQLLMMMQKVLRQARESFFERRRRGRKRPMIPAHRPLYMTYLLYFVLYQNTSLSSLLIQPMCACWYPCISYKCTQRKHPSRVPKPLLMVIAG